MVGVHTPEFGFERDVDNVVAQSRDFGVEYPVAVDSDYGVWRAFANHFWPAVYIADAEGRIRFHHFGEGEYAMTEMVIQQLLLDAGAEDIDQDLVDGRPAGLEVAADWRTLQSPETYLGYGQSTRLRAGDVAVSTAQPGLRAPSGCASTTGTSRGLDRRPARRGPERARRTRIAFQFHARDVNLVMGPASAVPPSRSGSSSMARSRTARTGPTWTPTAAGSSRTSAPTN